jgi:hypothetical protein
MQTEVFEAFRAIDVPEDKALKAAAALSKRDGAQRPWPGGGALRIASGTERRPFAGQPV